MSFGSRFTPVTFFTPAVPPFPANAADNGLSVDSVSGRIVLGNDAGDLAAPAQLLSNREIVTEDAAFNLFSIVLNSIQSGITTLLNGQIIQITGDPGNFIAIDQSVGDFGQAGSTINAGDNGGGTLAVQTGLNGQSNFSVTAEAGGFAEWRLRTDTDIFNINTAGAGFINFNIGNVFDVWDIDTASLNTQMGFPLQAHNGATLQVSGTFTHRELTAGFSGSRNIDRDLDSSRLFFNTAAGTLVLPNMAGANSRPGFNLRFACNNAAGITIQTDAGQTILMGTSATSAGGTVSSTGVGSYGRITLIDSFTWLTEYFTGSFTLT